MKAKKVSITTQEAEAIKLALKELQLTIGYGELSCAQLAQYEAAEKRLLNLLKKNKDSEKACCSKCGGRLSLVVGTFAYEPDEEPYESGVIEKSLAPGGETQVGAHKCDKCGHLQGFFIE
ncbi:hypothetical protein GPL06_13270 [Bacteroides salyersiae]|uniref:hypothetical protein n=1 Tax=Bacteroides salyersiae TaxID=291644 RepID=UPI001C01D114|nr:hypothetical protein [Bacteroides salyersiae]MBT9873765.1 hypothetical protein [Bacteroides salyersiae]